MKSVFSMTMAAICCVSYIGSEQVVYVLLAHAWVALSLHWSKP